LLKHVRYNDQCSVSFVIKNPFYPHAVAKRINFHSEQDADFSR
jgi:hypothetical protein